MEMNWTKLILVSSMAVLLGVIVLLVILLIPASEEEELTHTFTDVIELSTQAMSEIEFIRLVYDINVTDEYNNTIQGSMTYRNREGDEVFVLSSELSDYNGYAILPSPKEAFEIIQENNQSNFANDLTINLRPCHSTFTHPVNVTLKTYAEGGKLIYVACMDNEVGYPTLLLIVDTNGTHKISSKIFLKTLTFNKKV